MPGLRGQKLSLPLQGLQCPDVVFDLGYCCCRFLPMHLPSCAVSPAMPGPPLYGSGNLVHFLELFYSLSRQTPLSRRGSLLWWPPDGAAWLPGSRGAQGSIPQRQDTGWHQGASWSSSLRRSWNISEQAIWSTSTFKFSFVTKLLWAHTEAFLPQLFSILSKSYFHSNHC